MDRFERRDLAFRVSRFGCGRQCEPGGESGSAFHIPHSSTPDTRIGILGGTFDPVHIGHLIIAEEARYRLDLEKVIFVPAGTPPLKPEGPSAGKEDRYRMVALAVEEDPAFEAARIEIDRPGVSFTVDTLAEIKRIYGRAARLFFIAGVDAVLEILSWHKPEEIIRLCKLVAAARPGCDLSELRRSLPEEFMNRIVLLEVPSVDISSTELRARVSAGIPIKYLVPRAVEEYILANGLYGASSD